ncbi:hypothetical protein DIPPA_33931 [Diplonema papillatum]|nr:hypothetical protein DIPPA_33931 [Diplonema papillatum]
MQRTGEEGRSSTQSVSRDSLRVLDADNPVTTLLLSHRSTHSEEDLCAKQNKLLAEVNKSIAQIDCMGVAVIARPGRERAPKPILNNKPFKHLERVFVKASSQELQELSAKHGGWGGELMAECCRKVGVVYKPTAGQDPMVMFSDGQVWRMNQRALARDNEMRDLVEAAQLNQPMPLVSKKQRPRRTVRWRVGDVAKTSSLEQTQPAAKETPQARRERLGISQDARKRILKRSLSPDQLEMRNKGAGGPSPPRVPADTRPPANPTAARRLSNNATGTPPMPTHPVCPAAGGPPKPRSGGSREQRQPARRPRQKPAAGDCHQAAAPPPPHGQGEGDAGRAGELPARPGAVEGPQAPSDGRKKVKDESAAKCAGGGPP